MNRSKTEEKAIELGYRSTDLGRVLQPDTTRFIETKVRLSGDGYGRFCLKFGIRAEVLVHRFVWRYFRGPIPDGLLVVHVNGDRADNRIENLKLETRGENIRRQHASGARRKIV